MRGEKQTVAGTVCQKLHLRISLALVALEDEG